MKSTKTTSAKANPKTRGTPKPAAKATPKKAAKAPLRKVAKTTPKKVAKTTPKKVAKTTPTKVAKTTPKKVAKTTPKKVAKTKKVATAAPKKTAKKTAKKPSMRGSSRRVQSPAPASSPESPARVPLTPLVRTASSGVGSSGVAARGPADPELRAGDDLPAFLRRPVTRVDIARFCAASGDFNVIALDEPRARDAGLPAVVVPGGLAFALADACVRAWLGRDGRVCRSGARLVKMVWPDDELVARARVSDVRPGASGREVEFDVWVENQKGELVLRGQSTCAVEASGAGR